MGFDLEGKISVLRRIMESGNKVDGAGARLWITEVNWPLSGVTATVARLLPVQARSIGIAATGPGLPAHVPRVPLGSVLAMSGRKRRVWHARRNTEMALGLVLRHVLRKRLKLVFTSASQRRHMVRSWQRG